MAGKQGASAIPSASRAETRPATLVMKPCIIVASDQKPSDSAVKEAEKLSEKHGDNLTVQLLSSTILYRAGNPEAALALLSKHQGSLDAVALQIQIHLLTNRPDLAAKEAKSARSFAQDALLVNLAESWIGVRKGGEEYQKAFYVFEELAQNPSSASATSLTAQGVSEMHMGRTEEALAALQRAVELEPENAEALANWYVLEKVSGRDGAEARSRLEKVDKQHEVLKGLAEKKGAFAAAMEKYNPKITA